MTASRPPQRQPMRLGFGGGGMLTGEAAGNTRHTLIRMAAYLRPYRLQLLIVAFFVTISTVLRLFGPMLLGRAIDLYIVTGDIIGLRTLVMQIVAVYVGAAGTSAVQGLIMVVPWPAIRLRYSRRPLQPSAGNVDGIPRPQPGRRPDESYHQ